MHNSWPEGRKGRPAAGFGGRGLSCLSRGVGESEGVRRGAAEDGRLKWSPRDFSFLRCGKEDEPRTTRGRNAGPRDVCSHISSFMKRVFWCFSPVTNVYWVLGFVSGGIETGILFVCVMLKKSYGRRRIEHVSGVVVWLAWRLYSLWGIKTPLHERDYCNGQNSVDVINFARI